MSDLAIKVENVSKAYTIWRDPSARLKHPFLDLAGELFPALRPQIDEKLKGLCSEFYALRNVSFEVKKGESVGIIGRNGSGKSTLLQIIAGTLQPTEGSVTVNGRVAALLELGSGFNPEFTGRENVYLNCSILGLTKEETDDRFQSIADFADIGDFLEQPVKTYSSGMTMRLAFAVSINTTPDIFIVDEALSVGDELFQRKCFSRIEEIRKGGSTILFVSHSGGQIVELCDRAILLDSGEKIASGLPKQVLAKYQKLLYAPAEKALEIKRGIIEGNDSIDQNNASHKLVSSNNKCNEIEEVFDPHLVPTSTVQYESRGAVISKPRICTPCGKQVNYLLRGNRYEYRYNVEFEKGAINVRYGMMIKTATGFELGGATSAPAMGRDFIYQGEDKVSVTFEFDCQLNPGTYFLNAGVTGIVAEEEVYLHRLLDSYVFKVMPITHNKVTGIVDFSCAHIKKEKDNSF
jgi:lipopolysaccharide transport system ATP-binding protein